MPIYQIQCIFGNAEEEVFMLLEYMCTIPQVPTTPLKDTSRLALMTSLCPRSVPRRAALKPAPAKQQSYQNADEAMNRQQCPTQREARLGSDDGILIRILPDK